MRKLTLLFTAICLLVLTGCDPDSPLGESLVKPFINDVYPRLVRTLLV